ncbi:predicted protein [Naegleria gruberi]|uniref:Exocyst complex component Sec8 n=1 Tax=Naegleria gruberi TaxID=5762 RepID=D2VIT0_NAEGR|nr:uncharacterized protein NAEGRDRAFT_68784 [Naegleria gruberi]EFC43328.1 predicted protein [Naegleria gruberi]|eukprot:XP_002676072.1 predicted protein [Naegleria gruberi strain NEG-M]
MVSFNYEEFNKSIRNFSDILQELNGSQQKIQKLRDNVKKTKVCLKSHATDLSTLYTNYLQHSEYLRILNIVNEVKQVPDRISVLIEKKHYSSAIRLSKKCHQYLKNSPELKHIKGLEDIRNQLKNFEKQLPDKMIDALTTHLYSLDVEKCTIPKEQLPKSPMHARPISITEESIKKKIQNERMNTKKQGFQSVHERAFAMVQQKNTDSFDLADNTDLTFDPEQDSNYFLSMIIDGLDTLGKLSLLQSRMVHSLKYDVRSLIEKQILEFVNNLEEQGADFTWNISQSMLKESKSATSIQQGAILKKLFNRIFSNIAQLLEKYKFMIGIMELRAASLDFSSLTNTSEDTMVATPVDIKLTKPVIEKIKKAINEKIDHLKINLKTKEPSNYMSLLSDHSSKTKEANNLYLSLLTDLSNNFFKKNMEEDLRVRDVISFFEGQLSLKITKQTAMTDSIKEKFSSLITTSVSDSTTPHTFTATYVWKTAQEEIKNVLKDILGLTNLSSLVETLGSKSSTEALKNIIDTGAPSSHDDYKITFKYSFNVDYYEQSNEKSSDSDVSPIISHFSKYFLLSPYNMLWVYKEVSTFIDQCKTIVVDEIGKNDSNEYQSLKVFCDDIVRHYLLSVVKTDYRTKMNELLRKDSTAFNCVNSKDFASLLPNSNREIYNQKEIFLGSISCMRWISEIIVIAKTIPIIKYEFYSTIELVLKRYLDECYTFFDLALSSSYCQQILKQSRDYSSVLVNEPLFQKAQKWKPLNLKRKAVDPEEIRKIFEQLVDKPISNITYDSSRKTHVIDRTSGFMSLSALNGTLEWVLENIYLWHFDIISLTAKQNTSMTDFHHASKDKLFKHTNRSTSLLLNSSFQVVRQLEDYYEKFVELYNDCLLAIKIDLRIRCLFSVKKNLVQNLIDSDHPYSSEELTEQPESFVEEFNKDLLMIYRSLSTCTSEEKLNYVFSGIGKFISGLLINSLVTASKSSSPKFSIEGIQRMKRNITALQQQISYVTSKQELSFNSVIQYYELLLLDEIGLIEHARNIHTFTREQYLSIFKCTTPKQSIDKKKFERDLDGAIHKSKLIKKSASSATLSQSSIPTTPTLKHSTTATSTLSTSSSKQQLNN